MSTDTVKLDPAASAAAALERTAEFGETLARDFPDLSLRDVLAILREFKRRLRPPRKPGRRRSKHITAAYADRKAGIRGVALYERHIPGYRRMGYWKKKDKIRNLLDAIRKRERRQTTPKTVLPNKPVV